VGDKITVALPAVFAFTALGLSLCRGWLLNGSFTMFQAAFYGMIIAYWSSIVTGLVVLVSFWGELELPVKWLAVAATFLLIASRGCLAATLAWAFSIFGSF
jgi:hypothetical protein